MALSLSGQTGMILVAILAAGMMISSGEEVFVYANQPFVLNNTTLVVEDADPESGFMWAQIFNQRGLIWSGVLKTGESYNSSAVNFTVTEIYAGGNGYLVGLLFDRELVERPVLEAGQSVAQSPGPRLSPNMLNAQVLFSLVSLRLISRTRLWI